MKYIQLECMHFFFFMAVGNFNVQVAEDSQVEIVENIVRGLLGVSDSDSKSVLGIFWIYLSPVIKGERF
jgi:hypothetical protein